MTMYGVRYRGQMVAGWTANKLAIEGWAKTLRAQGYKGAKVVSKKENPAMKRASKTVRKERARKASAKRRVATALAGWLKRMNPGMKTAGAKVQRLKGGVIKVTPIKAAKVR